MRGGCSGSYVLPPPPFRPQIDAARGKALADEFHMRFFETSAKDGTNVRDAFHALARDVLALMSGGDAAAPAAEVTGKAGGGTKECTLA